MKFTPKSEEQMQREEQEAKNRFLWQPQECDFEILEAEDYTSSAGKQSIKCNIKIYNDEGRDQRVYVYLTPNYMRLFKSACDACGLTEQYEAGEIEADMFEGKSGRCKIKIDKSKDPQYADKNAIDIFVGAGSASKPPRAKASADLDDDIPF